MGNPVLVSIDFSAKLTTESRIESENAVGLPCASLLVKKYILQVWQEITYIQNLLGILVG